MHTTCNLQFKKPTGVFCYVFYEDKGKIFSIFASKTAKVSSLVPVALAKSSTSSKRTLKNGRWWPQAVGGAQTCARLAAQTYLWCFFRNVVPHTIFWWWGGGIPPPNLRGHRKRCLYNAHLGWSWFERREKRSLKRTWHCSRFLPFSRQQQEALQ